MDNPNNRPSWEKMKFETKDFNASLKAQIDDPSRINRVIITVEILDDTFAISVRDTWPSEIAQDIGDLLVKYRKQHTNAKSGTDLHS